MISPNTQAGWFTSNKSGIPYIVTEDHDFWPASLGYLLMSRLASEAMTRAVLDQYFSHGIQGRGLRDTCILIFLLSRVF